jgi:uncharacterized protein (DUF2147 family)
MKQLLITLFFTVFALQAFAAPTAVGHWKTFDEKTNQPEGEVIIYEENGLFYGKIGKSLDPKKQEKKYCTQCKGEFADKPLAGLRFMWDFKRAGDKYNDGKILDPNTGEIYNATMELKNDGNTLVLRGFIGLPLFGQNRTWERMK